MLTACLTVAGVMVPMSIVLIYDSVYHFLISETGCYIMVGSQIFVGQNFMGCITVSSIWHYIIVKFPLRKIFYVTSLHVWTSYVTVLVFCASYAVIYLNFAMTTTGQDGNLKFRCMYLFFSMDLNFILTSLLLVIVPCFICDFAMSLDFLRIVARHRRLLTSYDAARRGKRGRNSTSGRWKMYVIALLSGPLSWILALWPIIAVLLCQRCRESLILYSMIALTFVAMSMVPIVIMMILEKYKRMLKKKLCCKKKLQVTPAVIATVE